MIPHLKWTRRILFASLLAAVLCVALLPAQVTPAKGVARRVVEINVDDAIFPPTADYVVEGIGRVKQEGASLVLITMNTPGGLDTSMREIITAIIHSPVPVVVYVSPSGSRAASAGFFILLSADVAAMAPGTDTGASSPIFGSGAEKVDETLKRKATNEAAAYIRSIVGQRGRNVALAEKAVTEAKAFSEKEALQGKLIDLIAPNVDSLIAQLDGRTVPRFDGTQVTLDLKNVVRTSLEMTAKQRWLSYIARPDVLFILFTLGMLGIYVEFTHPGLIFPGVIGTVSLVLALVAMKVLPVNVIAVVLILLAVGLFVLEAKLTSYGLLGLAGVVAMLAGALLLIRSPITGMGVSLGLALGVTLPFALITIFLMRLVMRSFRWRFSTGIEQMIGEIGEVTEEIDGRGMIFVAGELWRAASHQPIPKGAQVRVVRVEGLTAHVEPVGDPRPPDGA